MTTRQAIRNELTKRAYPMPVEELKAVIGKTTVQFICRCMGLEGQIVERRFHGRYWYSNRAWKFIRRPFHVEIGQVRGWKLERMWRTELAGKQYGTFIAKQEPDMPVRLVRDGHVLQEWNAPEMKSWLDGKRTLLQLKRILRNQSNSPNAASTPAPTSRP